MELNEYQELAAVTGNNDISLREQRLNYALGLGESGELQNIVKKHVFHGHDEAEAKEQIKDEAGDILWYLSQVANVYGISLEEVAQHNVGKLKKRYPEGFSRERSQNRTD